MKDIESPKTFRKIKALPQPDSKEIKEDKKKRRGGKLFAEKKYAKARKCFKREAKRGNPQAQYNVGVTYYEEGNYTKALSWHVKAVEQMHPQAFYNIAVMHLKGEGVPQNHFIAWTWFNFAADLGHTKAKKTLKDLRTDLIFDENTPQIQYEQGVQYLIDKKYSESLAILEKAARNHSGAQNILGEMYRDGWGDIPPNREKAKNWFRKSAKQGFAEAQNNLGALYYEEEFYGLAREEFEKAAIQDHVLAQSNLGGVYKDILTDYTQAKQWLLRAARQGDSNAEFMLAGMHYEGKGFPLDKDKALEMLNKLAEKGDSNAQRFLESLKEK